MKRKQVAIVTGAGGFLGQHLVFTLEQRGYRVIHLPHKTLSVPEKLAIFFKKNKFDYLFHLAARGNMAYQKDDHDKIVWGNYIKSYNLLEATKDINYRAFINVSTSSVGLPHQTLYSATKLGVEALCLAYESEYKKPIVTIRPASCYGEGEADFRLIPTIFRSCLQATTMPLSLTPTHDWVHVSDVVDLLINAAERIAYVQGRAITCGTGIITTNKQIADLIVNITGKPLDVEGEIKRSFDTPNWHLSLNDYIATFGGAKMGLKEGLERCYEFYKVKYAKQIA